MAQGIQEQIDMLKQIETQLHEWESQLTTMSFEQTKLYNNLADEGLELRFIDELREMLDSKIQSIDRVRDIISFEEVEYVHNKIAILQDSLDCY